MGAMTVRICSSFYVSTNQNATFSFGHDNDEYATEKKTARGIGFNLLRGLGESTY